MSTSNPKPQFAELYQLVTDDACQNIDQLHPKNGQPGFITMCQANGRNIAFLGYHKAGGGWDADNFLGKHLQINQIIIPQHAQMLVGADIRDQLQIEDGACINIQPSDYDKMPKSIILNGCGAVRDFSIRNFHPCDNYISEVALGSFTCEFGFFHIAFDTSNEEPQYDLVLFYISKEDILSGVDSTPKQHKPTLHEKLNTYFDNQLSEDNFDGLFLIPRILPDQSTGYLGIINKPYTSYKGSVKESLNNWLIKIDEYNQSPGKYDLMIAGHDLQFCAIEEWSVMIGKNAELLTVDRSQRLLPESN